MHKKALKHCLRAKNPRYHLNSAEAALHSLTRKTPALTFFRRGSSGTTFGGPAQELAPTVPSLRAESAYSFPSQLILQWMIIEDSAPFVNTPALFPGNSCFSAVDMVQYFRRQAGMAELADAQDSGVVISVNDCSCISTNRKLVSICEKTCCYRVLGIDFACCSFVCCVWNGSQSVVLLISFGAAACMQSNSVICG